MLWKRFEIKSHQRRAHYLKPRRNGRPIPTGGGSRSPPPHWLGLSFFWVSFNNKSSFRIFQNLFFRLIWNHACSRKLKRAQASWSELFVIFSVIFHKLLKNLNNFYIIVVLRAYQYNYRKSIWYPHLMCEIKMGTLWVDIIYLISAVKNRNKPRETMDG